MSFRQALLRNGDKETVAWIPTGLAVVGKFLRIHGTDGWEVVKVSSSVPDAVVLARRDDYRHHRKASDI